MRKSPISSRLYVGIFGNTNSGKSSLFNSLIGQDLAIVSNRSGTTTDPITKGMELNPFGPIALVDTAGLDDLGDIGYKRTKKSRNILNRVDIAIYAADINDFDKKAYSEIIQEFDKRQIPWILAFTKADKAEEEKIKKVKNKYPQAVLVFKENEDSINELKKTLGKELEGLDIKDEKILADLVGEKSTIIMVTPIDSAAPKGRLILPQVQALRECLDHNLTAIVCQETELESALANTKKVDLVVTDSKVFDQVDKVVAKDIALTSFSILFARNKGDIKVLLEGTRAIKSLQENSKILMAEGCTHGQTHEDIGRVKIPRLLEEHTGKNLKFDFYSGYDFPENLESYDLVIHCGGCMLNKKEITTRLWSCEDLGIPVTNYGMVLALVNGILDRSTEIFSLNKEVKLDE